MLRFKKEKTFSFPPHPVVLCHPHFYTLSEQFVKNCDKNTRVDDLTNIMLLLWDEEGKKKYFSWKTFHLLIKTVSPPPLRPPLPKCRFFTYPLVTVCFLLFRFKCEKIFYIFYPLCYLPYLVNLLNGSHLSCNEVFP